MIDLIKQFIMMFFEEKQDKPKVKKEPNYNNKILLKAQGELGVKEVAGSGNNIKVLKYHAAAREDNDFSKALPDSVPWCASFICYILEACGLDSTNSMRARSYQAWGYSTKKEPLPGDLAVFWRKQKNGVLGHVAIYLSETEKFVYVLGGNQRDEVSVARYSKSKLLDVRRSYIQPDLSEPDEDRLWDMAERLIKGGKVSTNGKVV